VLALQQRLSQSQTAQRAIRYSLTSVLAVALSELTLVGLFGGLHWTARSANITACITGGIPSYYLNRRWAWGKAGRSHLWVEVAPFWALTFVGLAFSTAAAEAAESWSTEHLNTHGARTALVATAALAATGALWVVTFIIFNRFLFGRSEQPQ
jgi:putative flippase GtrA